MGLLWAVRMVRKLRRRGSRGRSAVRRSLHLLTHHVCSGDRETHSIGTPYLSAQLPTHTRTLLRASVLERTRDDTPQTQMHTHTPQSGRTAHARN